MLAADSAALAVAAFEEHGPALPIDYEHQTLGGSYAAPDGQAPAAGWIKAMIAEPGSGLWAEIEWTEQAIQRLERKEYRYLSPVAIVRKVDRKLVAIHSAALTNKPAIVGMRPIVNRAEPDADLAKASSNGADSPFEVLRTELCLPPNTAAEEVLVRPDGRWALAASANQLWVVAVPPSTGTTPTVSLTGPSVPVKKITDIGADYFAWADDGETITWAIGSTFFQRPFDSIEFGDEDESDDDEAAEAEDDEAEEGDAGDDEAAGEEDEDEDQEEEDEPKAPLDEDESVEFVEIVMEFPRAQPTGTIALRGATVITMEGDQVIENADIVVTDNRIAALGPRGSVTIPYGAI